MTRVILIKLLSLIIGCGSLLANEGPYVNEKAREALKREFPGVHEVKWENIHEYQMASFAYGDNLLVAYFNADGDFIGSARTILYQQLPMSVTRSILRQFPDADFLINLELSNPEATFYWLTIEAAGKRFRIETGPGGNIMKIIKIRS